MLYKILTTDGSTVVIVAHDIRELTIGRNGTRVVTSNGSSYAVNPAQAQLIEDVMGACHPTTSETIMAIEPTRPKAPIQTDVTAAVNQAMSSQGQPGAAANLRGPAMPSVVPFEGPSAPQTGSGDTGNLSVGVGNATDTPLPAAPTHPLPPQTAQTGQAQAQPAPTPSKGKSAPRQ